MVILFLLFVIQNIYYNWRSLFNFSALSGHKSDTLKKLQQRLQEKNKKTQQKRSETSLDNSTLFSNMNAERVKLPDIDTITQKKFDSKYAQIDLNSSNKKEVNLNTNESIDFTKEKNEKEKEIEQENNLFELITVYLLSRLNYIKDIFWFFNNIFFIYLKSKV